MGGVIAYSTRDEGRTAASSNKTFIRTSSDTPDSSVLIVDLTSYLLAYFAMSAVSRRADSFVSARFWSIAQFTASHKIDSSAG
jgi:hypothetical protein